MLMRESVTKTTFGDTPESSSDESWPALVMRVGAGSDGSGLVGKLPIATWPMKGDAVPDALTLPRMLAAPATPTKESCRTSM